MIEFLEVSLASYFYFCPFTPGAFSMPRGKREVSFFFLCVSLILSGGRPRRSSPRTRKGFEKEDSAVKNLSNVFDSLYVY